ncbi:MAG: short-chain dehydrogenase [Candidatus Tectimicrobiota bacterium]|nr:MAG: short-chain dehydrogenase [Candidatus Tectomicrobia bacterium]
MRLVITGVTSGIGRGLAYHYAQPGAVLGLIGRRQERLAAVTEHCRAQGATVLPAPLDVRHTAAMQAYAADFIKQAGGIDLVIANAGIGDADNLSRGDAAYHARLFEVNVIGLLNTLLPFIPQMQRQGHGQLVAIASVAGFRALPGSTTYAATKMAVRALMEGYGWELRRYGILTTTINPGFVVSEMTAANRFPMPFLQPTEVAVCKIARAIARRRRVYTFPWPMAVVARLLPWLPGALLARVAPRRPPPA